MSDVLRLVFSLSLSGSLLILVLFLCKPFFKDRASRRWQYYIWLVAVARLLLPFAPEGNLMETLFERAERMVGRMEQSEIIEQTEASRQPEAMEQMAGSGQMTVREEGSGQTQEQPGVVLTDSSGSIFQLRKITRYIGMLWLGIAMILLIRKITMYQSFVKYIRAGGKEVSDVKLLDLLAENGERLGIKRPVELYINEQVSSPLLIGLFHPCIVLPSADLPEIDFQYTIRHELIHYRHYDVLYKWLVQITVCLHWFNPLVWMMRKETGRACELACDEAVMKALDEEGRRIYGDVLVRAAEHKGAYREPLASVTLSESGELLKERLRAIGHFQKRSKMAAVVSAVSVIVLTAGAAMTGAAAPAKEYEISAKTGISEAVWVKSGEASMETLEIKGTTYYLVFNEAQLRAIGTGEYGPDKNYMQQADIQLSEEEWKPIGTQNKPFTGSYNGNGFEIIGLTITGSDVETAGMFGVAYNAHIYNITLRDSNVILNRSIADQPNYPILAYDLGGSRVYDNITWLSEESVTETINSASGKNRDENMAGIPGTDSNESEGYVSDEGGDKATEEALDGRGDMSSGAEEYYENGNRSGFGRAFYELDEKEQEAWLNRAYHDEEIAFFAVALQQLDAESALFEVFAQKAYTEENISFFSVLTDYMSESALEGWLHKAIMDRKFGFQSVLYTALDRDWEKEALEEELDKQREEEYKSVGITKDGKKYYYQGQLVNIFLDMKPDSAFYTLDMNPEGTVNIKIVRDAAGAITSVEYMAEEEVKERFGDAQVMRSPYEDS